MKEKKLFINRLVLLAIVAFGLLAVNIVILISELTSAKYISSEQDEILSHYTELYFDHKLINKSVALDNKIGYVELELKNYKSDDVTQRNIEYEIKKPEVFYDINGSVIDSNTITDDTDLYVLDVWGTPIPIANATYKYDVSIVSNDGETITTNDETNYGFIYEKIGTSGVGKTHHITLKIERTDESDLNTDENISIVVQLIKPYREAYVINISVSNRLIVYSVNKLDDFGVKQLSIQSVDLYAYTYDKTTYLKRAVPGMGSSNGYYTSKAIRVTIQYQGLHLNVSSLNYLHIGLANDISDLSNLDITKPYLYFEKDSGSANYKKLTIYVPQGSNFTLSFVDSKDNMDQYIKILSEVYIKDNSNERYINYNYAIGGYDENGLIQFDIK